MLQLFVCLKGILIFTFSSHTKASFGDYVFSDTADGFGWAMASSSVLLIPLFTIYEAYKTHQRGEVRPINKLKLSM